MANEFGLGITPWSPLKNNVLLTAPRFGYPNNMLDMAPGVLNCGTTVNGAAWPNSQYVMPEVVQP